MSDEQKTPGSAPAGSPDSLINSGPNANTFGQPQSNTANANTNTNTNVDLSNFVPKDQFSALEKKLGEQGSELGDYRKFMDDIQPLLDKLQAEPEIAEAILEGKINGELAKAVMEGKVDVNTATQVADANAQVKKEMGDKAYNKAPGDEIEKRITEKIDGMNKKIEEVAKSTDKKINDANERVQYENYVTDFIKNTPDYTEYAETIAKWLEDHPDQWDIEIAYHTVKGKVLSDKAKTDADKNAAEEAKKLAGNAGGGAQTTTVNDPNLVDSLIGGRKNPNIF